MLASVGTCGVAVGTWPLTIFCRIELSKVSAVEAQKNCPCHVMLAYLHYSLPSHSVANSEACGWSVEPSYQVLSPVIHGIHVAACPCHGAPCISGIWQSQAHFMAVCAPLCDARNGDAPGALRFFIGWRRWRQTISLRQTILSGIRDESTWKHLRLDWFPVLAQIWLKMKIWLVVWNMIFFHILGIVNPTD